MKPYYDEGGITIYHGDCREIWPAMDGDAVVTDPPYGTGYYPSDSDALSPRMVRAWVEHGPCVIFGWPERLVALCMAAGCLPTEWVTWWPTNGRARGMSRALWRENESIAVFGGDHWHTLMQPRSERAIKNGALFLKHCPGTRRIEPAGVSPYARRGDVWTDPMPGVGFNGRGERKRQHPNEKPVAVMRRLLEGVGSESVLDPFAGSGSTLVAARQQGLRAIGIEIEERYCEIAARRLAQEVLPLETVA